jgi:uncharacterized delta-60 repeat protein
MPKSILLCAGVLVSVCAAAFALAASQPVPADVVGTSIGADLMLDASYGSGGSAIVNFNDADGTWDEPVRALVADDGGLWLLGFHRVDAGGDRFAIAKLDADGAPDPSFGDGGRKLVDTGVTFISDAVIGGGRFYVAGMYLLSSSGSTEFAIACVELDGTLCAGFGDGGTVTIAINPPGYGSSAARVLYRDGALYAIGNTDLGGGDFGHTSAIAVAKLDAATGALDVSFGNAAGTEPGTSIFDPALYASGGFDYARAAAFASDGDVLIGGSAQTAQNQSSDGYVLALDAATGELDGGFGENGYAYLPIQVGVHLDQVTATALAVRDDGRILVAGDANHDDADFNIMTDVLLAALEPNGSLAADFAGGGLAHVNVGFNTETTAMALRADGDLVVSMQSSGLLPDEYYPFSLQSVVQFDASGDGPISTVSLEFPSSEDQSPLARPSALAVDASDRVIVAGLRLWGYPNYPAPDFDITATRLVSDVIFAQGFE